eukprot:TRINITY_DN1754_c0_g1_i6.p1 TRINITY_DN1754_c0_g1~~TRINITY_DN1754_c0_g1_i6.p1  ORF type:complete len:970 (+),score=182.57 TRINITY_DN1754_c0_g1_i6:261-3170(+)
MLNWVKGKIWGEGEGEESATPATEPAESDEEIRRRRFEYFERKQADAKAKQKELERETPASAKPAVSKNTTATASTAEQPAAMSPQPEPPTKVQKASPAPVFQPEPEPPSPPPAPSPPKVSAKHAKPSSPQPELSAEAKRSRVLAQVLGVAAGEELITQDNMEDKLMGVLMSLELAHGVSPFEYLVQAFQRMEQICSNESSTSESREAALSTQAILGSYAGICVILPDTFGDWKPRLGPIALVRSLTVAGVGQQFPVQLLNTMVNGLEDADRNQFGEELVAQLLEATKEANIMSAFLAPLRGLATIVGSQHCANLVVQVPQWQVPAWGAPSIVQNVTPLGGMLSVGMMDPDVIKEYFGDLQHTAQRTLDMNTNMLRQNLTLLHRNLTQTFLGLLRNGGSRDQTIQWMAAVLNQNHARTSEGALMGQMMNQVSTNVSDDFAINLNVVLLGLCAPFIDPKSPKAAGIEPALCENSELLNLSRCARMGATDADVQAAVGQGRYSFVSECFWMAAVAHHIGICATYRSRCQYEQHPSVGLGRIQERMQSLMQSRSQWENTPQAAMYEGMITDALSRIGGHLAQRTQLFHPDIITSSLRFAELVLSLLLKWGTVNEEGQDENPSFRFVPEFLVEDVGETVAMCARHGEETVLSYPITPIVESISILLSANSPVKLKPHLRNKLVESIHALSPGSAKHLSEHMRSMRDMTFTPIFYENPVVLQHLFGGLLHQYVNVERAEDTETTSSTQTIRIQITSLFQFLCSCQRHIDQLLELNKGDNQRVLVKFVNMLATDLTAFFDEGITMLQRIKQAQIDQDNKAWDVLDPDARKAKEQQLSQDEQYAPGYIRMVDELMFLLKTMTATIAEVRPHTHCLNRMIAGVCRSSSFQPDDNDVELDGRETLWQAGHASQGPKPREVQLPATATAHFVDRDLLQPVQEHSTESKHAGIHHVARGCAGSKVLLSRTLPTGDGDCSS